eukprot:SAG31_NODE_2957_length_4857_cov_47.100883_6_plen_178_part_00
MKSIASPEVAPRDGAGTGAGNERCHAAQNSTQRSVGLRIVCHIPSDTAWASECVDPTITCVAAQCRLLEIKRWTTFPTVLSQRLLQRVQRRKKLDQCSISKPIHLVLFYIGNQCNINNPLNEFKLRIHLATLSNRCCIPDIVDIFCMHIGLGVRLIRTNSTIAVVKLRRKVTGKHTR